MALHRLTHVTVGVPDVDAARSFYLDFGLTSGLGDWLCTQDGGAQLHFVQADWRHVLEIGVGVESPDDLDRVRRSLAAIDAPGIDDNGSLLAVDRGTGVTVRLAVADPIVQIPSLRSLYNDGGHADRLNARAEGLLREGPVRPKKLGHVVIGSVDHAYSERFFVDGLGFKVSDSVTGRAAFLRCSTDHHNVLIQGTPARFLHHTSWQLDDVDDVGRGAYSMLEADPARHVWGLGRHHIGSNFFYYLRDPAGNFAEYYSDLDVIVDDELWKPEVFEGHLGLFNWGPKPPPSFLKPDDLAALMSHR
jgi:catechol 2,3-dioxygenase-like lactoylglutathione lyase family enzyme